MCVSSTNGIQGILFIYTCLFVRSPKTLEKSSNSINGDSKGVEGRGVDAPRDGVGEKEVDPPW